jgi:hypothetical protein
LFCFGFTSCSVLCFTLCFALCIVLPSFIAFGLSTCGCLLAFGSACFKITLSLYLVLSSLKKLFAMVDDFFCSFETLLPGVKVYLSAYFCYFWQPCSRERMREQLNKKSALKFAKFPFSSILKSGRSSLLGYTVLWNAGCSLSYVWATQTKTKLLSIFILFFGSYSSGFWTAIPVYAFACVYVSWYWLVIWRSLCVCLLAVSSSLFALSPASKTSLFPHYVLLPIL